MRNFFPTQKRREKKRKKKWKRREKTEYYTFGRKVKVRSWGKGHRSILKGRGRMVLPGHGQVYYHKPLSHAVQKYTPARSESGAGAWLLRFTRLFLIFKFCLSCFVLFGRNDFCASEFQHYDSPDSRLYPPSSDVDAHKVCPAPAPGKGREGERGAPNLPPSCRQKFINWCPFPPPHSQLAPMHLGLA
jgi:hypothetical protein